MSTDEIAEAAFVYGPFAFVGASFVASVPLARRLQRRFGRLRPRAETFWERPALGERAVSLLAALSVIWALATGVGLLLLALPDPRGPATALRIDAALVAHAVPPLSARAATHIADELRRGEGVSRFSPPGAMEARMVAASRVDPRPERAIAALAARGFRTHAGRFALGSRSLATCDAGLDAFAEALQGSALQQLMSMCRNAPGDAVAHAAMKMGDFSRGMGADAESIVSRQPRSPRNEPSCFAGGYEVPPASQPICRLIHAEMVPKSRRAIHATPVRSPAFAASWWEVARLGPGEAPPPHARFTIDPELLLRRPHAALRDQPIAVLAEIHRRGVELDDPMARAWVRLAVAASASQRADRSEATRGVLDALEDIERAGEDDVQRSPALRLALAIAVRAGAHPVISLLAGELPPDDPLVARSVLAGATPPAPDDPPWVRHLLAGHDGASVADALHAQDGVPEDLGRLAIVPADAAHRAPLREWVRDAFPACDGCGFDAQLDRLTLRLDAAHALEDAALLEALDDVHRRHEAVVLNRLLALSLRAAL